MEPDDERVRKRQTFWTTRCTLAVLVYTLILLAAIGGACPSCRLYGEKPLECPAYLVLYLISKLGESFGLTPRDDYPPLQIGSKSQDPVRRALDELVGYDERHQGGLLRGFGCCKPMLFFSMVPHGTTVLGVWHHADTITVDLDEHVLDFGEVESRYSGMPAMRGKCQLGFLAQVVFTATGKHEDAGVQVLVRGQPVKHLGSGDTDFSRT